MVDSLHAILKRGEREPAILHADDVAIWSPGDLEYWLSASVLRPIPPADVLPCWNCGGEHVGEIVYLNDAAGRAHAYLPCPHCGPAEISLAALRRWQVDIERLLGLVAEAFVPKPAIAELVAGRMWRLGRLEANRVGVFFGRQMERGDRHDIMAQAKIPDRAVMLVSACPPAAAGAGPLVLPVATLVRFAGGQLGIDGRQFVERVSEYLSAHIPARRPPRPKRAPRTTGIELLTQEMKEHLRAARDYAVASRDRTGEPRLLPRPTQGDLGRRTGLSQCAVSRCLHDPTALELRFLWGLAVDLPKIVGYGE